MIIYVEKEAKNYSQTKKIVSNFKNPEIIFIDNYKNIFDKNVTFFQEKSIIISKLKWNATLETPPNYWPSEISYFFKTWLNCIFDCSYCYLKWAFKNNFWVFFVNYEDIKKQIDETIKNLKTKKFSSPAYFYSSDYSDNLWANNLNNFVEEFVPFFEEKENVIMEIRTKSTNIKSLLDLKFIPKNTEIAFSLNPQSLIEKYEKLTPNLDERIDAINKLLEKWFLVWLRFLPLLPVDDFENIYKNFLEKIKKKINLKKINSIIVSWLLYTKDDYNKILKKFPRLDILYKLKEEENNFIKLDKNKRKNFYKLFKDFDKKTIVCLEENK